MKLQPLSLLIASLLLAQQSLSFASPSFSPKAEATNETQPQGNGRVMSEEESQAYQQAKSKAEIRDALKATYNDDQKLANDAKAIATAKTKLSDQAKAILALAKKARLQAEASLASAAKAKVPAKLAAAKEKDIAKKTDALKIAQQKEASAQNSANETLASSASAQAESNTKAAIAAHSNTNLNIAREEFRKARTILGAINRVKAKAHADMLANGAYGANIAATASDRAKENARAAANTKFYADAQALSATKLDADAKQLVIIKTDSWNKAKAEADTIAAAKAKSDAQQTEAQKLANEAKLALAAASAAAMKSAAAANSSGKAMAEANAKANVANKALADLNAVVNGKAFSESKAQLEKALQASNDAATKAAANPKDKKLSALVKQANQNLSAAKAKMSSAQAAASAAQALIPAKAAFAAQTSSAAKKAQEANAIATAQAAADSLRIIKAKSDSEMKFGNLKKAIADSALAGKNKANADAKLMAASKALTSSIASAIEKSSAKSKAIAGANAAAVAKNLADEKSAEAAQVASAARLKHDSVFAQKNLYQIELTTEQQQKLDEERLYSAAVWNKVPNASYWTSLAVAAIRANIDRLERAQDLEEFCPGYRDASSHAHEVCWLRIIGGLSKFESAFNPTDGFAEPNGNMSVGLLALSPKECKDYDTEKLLKDPLLNLGCGVGIMAHLVERDGMLSGPEGRRGASAYWSVLRAPYTFQTPTTLYHLGKKALVVEISSTYTRY